MAKEIGKLDFSLSYPEHSHPLYPLPRREIFNHSVFHFLFTGSHSRVAVEIGVVNVIGGHGISKV